jgi:hypothetical protein
MSSSFSYSVVLLLPATLQDKGNRLACALGYDELPGKTFIAPASADGVEPATHYGCHTWAQQSFVDTLNAAAQGQLPAVDWAAYGLTEPDMQGVVASLVVSVRVGGEPYQHWTETLAGHGLRPAAVTSD